MSDLVSFVLYISGRPGRGVVAEENLRRLCSAKLKTHYQIQVVDVSADPEVAVNAQILALPMLEIHHAGKTRRMFGDLSLLDKFIDALASVRETRTIKGEVRRMMQHLRQAGRRSRSGRNL